MDKPSRGRGGREYLPLHERKMKNKTRNASVVITSKKYGNRYWNRKIHTYNWRFLKYLNLGSGSETGSCRYGSSPCFYTTRKPPADALILSFRVYDVRRHL